MKRAAIVLTAMLALGCGASRVRAPLPRAASPLVATSEDAFRDAPPVATITRELPAPTLEMTLANGVTVVIVERHDMPIAAVTLASRASGGDDAAAIPGVDTLLERVLWDEAARIAPQIAGTGRPMPEVLSNGALLGCDVVPERVEIAIDAIARIARDPEIARDAVTRERRSLDREIAISRGTLQTKIAQQLRTMLYGASDPRSREWFGDREAFRRLDREALRARHRALFAPAETAIFVVGDVDAARIRDVIERSLGSWAADARAPEWIAAPTFPTAGPRARGFAVNGDDSVIRLRERAPSAVHADRAGFEVITALLGGMFGARINQLLREERGHTYGVHATTSYERAHGTLQIDLTVPSSTTRSVIQTLVEEMRRISDPSRIDAAELARARSHAIAELRARFAMRSDHARTLASHFLRHESLADLAARMRAIESMDAQEVARVARAWLRPEAAPIVVAGDGQYLFWSMNGIPGGYELVQN